MDRQHGSACAGGREDRRSDRVGNVVQLEIQKNRVAAVAQLMNQGIALRQVEFEADLEKAAVILDPLGESQRRLGFREVQRYDEPGVHCRPIVAQTACRVEEQSTPWR